MSKLKRRLEFVSNSQQETPATPDHSQLRHLSDLEVLATWTAAMQELRRRDILRSDNTPTGDYAEWLVATRLGLVLEPNSKSGFDAKGSDGIRYQIKARRLATAKTSRQLSPIRNLDHNPFDFLIVVLFGPRFDVLECCQIPLEVVREHAKYRSHVNGHILHARGAVLEDERTVKLFAVESATQRGSSSIPSLALAADP